MTQILRDVTRVIMRADSTKVGVAQSGAIGVIARHDRSDSHLPYYVRWNNGETGWYGPQHVDILPEEADCHLVLLTEEPVDAARMRTTTPSALIKVTDLSAIDLKCKAAHFSGANRDVNDLFAKHSEWCYVDLRQPARYKHAYLMVDGQLVKAVNPQLSKPETRQYPEGKLYVLRMSQKKGDFHTGVVVRLRRCESPAYFGDEGYLVEKINSSASLWIPSSSELIPFE